MIAGTAVAEVSTTFDFASAYVFRGVTYNDGPVFQPGIEAAGLGMPEAYGALFNRRLHGGTADKEGNIGAGYEIVGIGLGYTAYFNVGSGGKDIYNEFTLGYGKDLAEGLALGLGASAAYVAADEGDSGFADGSLSADISYALGEVWSVGASITYIPHRIFVFLAFSRG